MMKVAGVSFQPAGQALICQLADRGIFQVDMKLVAEPDNPVDADAVAVYIRSSQQGGAWIQAGYLPAGRTETPQGAIYGSISRYPDHPGNPGLKLNWSVF